MRRTLKLFLFLAAAVVSAIAQQVPNHDISISGKVTDTKGALLSGALVALKDAGLSATTGTGGEFHIDYTTNLNIAQIGLPGARALKASLESGRLFIQASQNTPITVTIFSLRGKVLSSIKRQTVSDAHWVALPVTGAGIFFIKISAIHCELLLKGVSTGETWHGKPASFRLFLKSPESAKQAASTATFNDVLTVTKAGYYDFQMSLSTADTSGLVIKLTETGELPKFSFFVTSLKSMRELSGSQDGFGGDLRFGETGPGAGLRGADKICAAVAEKSMPGSSAKVWRAFMSISADENGKQINAIDRIGSGPWYDRLGRIVSNTKKELLNPRPAGAHPIIKDDLPNEFGIPNSDPDVKGETVDNHHFLTGSNAEGELYDESGTCEDWTSTSESAGRPHYGYSFTVGGRIHWISGGDEAGCGAGIHLEFGMPADLSNPVVGSGGGYGGIYCFALTP